MADANNDDVSVKEDAVPNTVSGNVVLNDISFDGSPVTVTSFGTFPMNYGTLVLNADGTFIYTLDNGLPAVDALNNGQTLTDIFIYNVSGDFASLTITVQGTSVNQMPSLAADTNSITEDTAPNPVMGNVLANDSDPDSNDTLAVTNGGTFNLNYGTLVMNSNGGYAYTLNNSNPAVNALSAGQFLTETFNYSVSDGFGGTASSTLTLTINGTTDNGAPIAVADVNSIKEDTPPNPVTGNVLTSDSDPDGHALSVTNAGTFNLGHGSLVINANGTYTYTLDNTNPAVNALNNGQTLSDSFTYNVSDGHGGTAASSLTITINGTTDNRAPVATADVNSVMEDTTPNPIMGNVLTNDSDPDGNTLSVTNAGTFTLAYGVLVIHADGSYTYTLDNSNPAVNALNNGQSLSDSFGYNVSDGHGGTASSSLAITINGSTDNRAPFAVADVNSARESDGSVSITGDLLTNDSDIDGDTVQLIAVEVAQYGVINVNLSDGSYTYTFDSAQPAIRALDEGETLTETIGYSIGDGRGGMAISNVTITINGTNGNVAPVNAVPGAQHALRNNALVFSAATGNSLALSDLDAGAADVEVTLSASAGAMTLSQTTGLSFTLGDGVADTSFTFAGTIADINAALDGLEIVSDNTGAISISMTTSDLGNTGTGGAKVDVDIISIDVETNVIEGNSKGDSLRGTALNDELIGRGGNDFISGGFGDDIIRGGDGNDRLYNWLGNATIDGGGGDDRIMSGRGADTLMGGDGADVFTFRRASSTQPTVPDHATIMDFSVRDRDRIDISFIDANENKRGNQAFAFIGTDAFSGKAGELRIEESGGRTFVYGDTDGGGAADLVIEFSSVIALRERHFDL
ncbi:cadherin-like domain-containing protein [Rhizobium sp. TH2]|uniref:VCBS domain-containing protein n=1 Tax=Rhizobium sp. TH2 TaxID=2775403 RepID=UPI0021582B7F|nr:VCBS domain-containing protein [Rhizobium sp. TH2]UVC10114.1 cadherin-like domain-containing protein [Rhizobium sp. TH2]